MRAFRRSTSHSTTLSPPRPNSSTGMVLRAALAASATAAALWTTTLSARADPPPSPPPALPPTLAGEQFTQASSTIRPAGCGSGSFTTSGLASGPYSGTYTETVTFIGTPTSTEGSGTQVTTTGTVASVDATFTIVADNGATVSGSKTLDSQGSPGTCGNFRTLRTVGAGDTAPLTYDTAITMPDGTTYQDTGIASVGWGGSGGLGIPSRWEFSENFTASNGLRPTDEGQCKNGGWPLFDAFENEGDCVSFVATGGKNPPNGS